LRKGRTGTSARNADQVQGRQLVLSQPKYLTQDALPTVPRNGAADLSRHRETQSRMVQAIGDAADSEEMVRQHATCIEHAAEFCRLEEAKLFVEAMVGEHVESFVGRRTDVGIESAWRRRCLRQV
jgi:hypothetical protein